MSLNTAHFEGRLAITPELETTANDTSVCDAVVLVNRRVRDGEEWVDAEPTRYRIKAWRRHADQLSQLAKGTELMVIGHVETETWTDKDTGEKRTRDTVVVDALGVTAREHLAQIRAETNA